MWVALLIQNWKSILGAALIAGAGLTGYIKGKAATQSEWDVATARQVKVQLEKNQADSAKLKKLEEKANVESQDNLRLRANNHALWLRLPKTPCGGAGAPSGDTAAGTGELPTQSELYLAEAKRQLDDEALRADEIVKACRVLNDFIRQ